MYWVVGYRTEGCKLGEWALGNEHARLERRQCTTSGLRGTTAERESSSSGRRFARVKRVWLFFANTVRDERQLGVCLFFPGHQGNPFHDPDATATECPGTRCKAACRRMLSSQSRLGLRSYTGSPKLVLHHKRTLSEPLTGSIRRSTPV